MAPDIYFGCYKTYQHMADRAWKGSSQYEPSSAGDSVLSWPAPPEHLPEVSHVMCQELQFALFSSFHSVCGLSVPQPRRRGSLEARSVAPSPFRPSALHLQGLRNHRSSVFTGAAKVRFLFSACTNGKVRAKGYFARQLSQPLAHWARSMSCWQRHRFDHASLMGCHCYRTNSKSSAPDTAWPPFCLLGL